VLAFLGTSLLFPGREQFKCDLGLVPGNPQASKEQGLLFSADLGKRLSFLGVRCRPLLDSSQVPGPEREIRLAQMDLPVYLRSLLPCREFAQVLSRPVLLITRQTEADL